MDKLKKFLDLGIVDNTEINDVLTFMSNTILETQNKLVELGFSKEDAITIIRNKLLIF